jgi:DEAD/DEAH box helicase/Zinc finger C-x8-C-x5-C-x3-H type (and similar)
MSEAAQKKTQQRRRYNKPRSTDATGSIPSKHAGVSSEGGPRPKRPKTTNPQLCREFLKSGTCSFGEKCRYMHTTTSAVVEDDEVVGKPDTVMGEPAPVTTAPPVQGAHTTAMKFADLNISSETKKSMSEIFKYELMTQVQAETLPVILNGIDCLAKAKTGTGKTLGFLIPAVEQLLKARDKMKRDDIGCLILSPTRELAFQIHKEAEQLTKFHNMKTMSCVGGTSISKDNTALKNSIQILVSTPGRLLDHLQNGELAKRLANMQVLIMDEGKTRTLFWQFRGCAFAKLSLILLL